MVKPKKHLGQHFLKDASISEKIAASIIPTSDCTSLLEIGPGTGALTKFLLELPHWQLAVCEIDRESVAWLKVHYPGLSKSIIEKDFLTLTPGKEIASPITIVGNFPYNISTQIVFHILEHRTQVPQMVGMFQREVARRIASAPGTKEYGILSVLTQAYYRVEYLFTVDEDAFIPPPKVKSGVIRMIRYRESLSGVDEEAFFKLVKLAFNQRRKTLRNSIKSILDPEAGSENTLLSKRPEQLSVDDFMELLKLTKTRNEG